MPKYQSSILLGETDFESGRIKPSEKNLTILLMSSPTYLTRCRFSRLDTLSLGVEWSIGCGSEDLGSPDDLLSDDRVSAPVLLQTLHHVLAEQLSRVKFAEVGIDIVLLFGGDDQDGIPQEPPIP